MRKEKVITYEEAVARLRKLQGERSIKAFARELKMSRVYLGEIYRGTRGLGPKVLKHLKLRENPPPRPTYTELDE
jgi:hypothetical protein